MTGCFQFQFRGFVYFTEPVDVACTEFKRSVAFHFVTAFFLFGNDGQAACRYPDTRDPAFIRVSVFPEPDYLYRIIFPVRKGQFRQ